MADVNDGSYNIAHGINHEQPPPFLEYVAPFSNLGTITMPRATVQMFRDAEHRVAGRVTLEDLPSTFWVRYPAVPANVSRVVINVPPEGQTTVNLTTFNPPVTTVTSMAEPPLWMKPCPCPLWDVLMREE